MIFSSRRTIRCLKNRINRAKGAPPDITPDVWTFLTPGTNLPLNTYINAQTFVVTGLEASTLIFATGAGEYRIEDGPWLQTASFCPPNAAVSYRVLSANAFDTDTPNLLSIGGVTASLPVHTAIEDVTPDTITFVPVTNADPSTHYTQTFTVTGINSTAAVSCSGPVTVSINGGAQTTTGTITLGQTIEIDVFSSPDNSTEVVPTVTIGGLTIPCHVTTKAAVVDPPPPPPPDPSDIPQPKAGAADYTAVFQVGWTALQRRQEIQRWMDQAYTDMQLAADPTNAPKKLAIPAGACGSIFFTSHDYPSQLSVVPVDYANPPTFWRFGGTSPIHNVVFDGLRTDMTATNGGLTTFTQVITFTACNNITLSNWQVNVGGPIGNLLNVNGCANFTAYRCEFVGGYQHTCYLGQKSQSAPGNASTRPRLIQCSFRGSREDFVRPWGATDFLIDTCYIGDGYRNGGGQHADGMQIAQIAAPNSVPSSGLVNNCFIVSRNGPDQTSGIFMSDNNVPYNDVRFTNNTIVGCDLNSICMRGVASGGVITGNKCYAVDFNMFTPAGTRIMAKMLVTGSGSGAVGVTLQNNQSYLYGDDTSTFAVREVPSSSGMNLGADPSVIQPMVDAWRAAHPGVPFNTVNFAAVNRGYDA